MFKCFAVRVQFFQCSLKMKEDEKKFLLVASKYVEENESLKVIFCSKSFKKTQSKTPRFCFDTFCELIGKCGRNGEKSGTVQ